MDYDERARFETEELRGLAQMHGAKRIYRNGIGAWSFPPWVCRHCGLVDDGKPKDDCPEKLAHHASEAEMEAWRKGE